MQTSPPAELGDKEIVALAQKGDREAFGVLVERYKQKAYRIAFDFTRDREEAKDLSQEAFLRAFTHLKRFDLRAGFYTWFYRILVNLCLDYCRRRGRISWEPWEEKTESRNTTNTNFSPDQEAIAREISHRVGASLNALPSKQRTAFILRNHQGLSIQDIAKVMQTADATVRVHLYRAIAALRQNLTEFL